MTERVARLRACSLETKPWLSLERARLMTEFYRTCDAALSMPVRRALSLAYLMERKTIYIGEEELIVGERGPRPKARPPIPSSAATAWKISKSCNTREKISYCVGDEARRIQREEIIPYWQGHSMRDRMFAEMTPEWKDAYEAGIFTEFMEQRAPGHTVLGDVIYRKGLLDLQAGCRRQRWRAWISSTTRGPTTSSRSCGPWPIAADAVIRFAERHAELAAEMAAAETRSAAQSRTGADRRRLPPRAGARAAQFPGSAAGLLVHPPRRHHRAEYLGLLQSRATWTSTCIRSTSATWPAARSTREQARELLAVLLGEVQQPARAAQGGRHRGRERHLHRLLQHQHRRPQARRLVRRQRADATWCSK